MSVNDNLGMRMKTYYEQVPKYRLMRRTPVAIRIDGKAFHTFTRGFEKPFDKALGNAMARTMTYLCQNIQGCVFGYTQSDEITLILVDYQTFETDAWFGYEVQKLCSISASMATMAFNRFFKEETETFRRRVNNTFTCTEAEDKLCGAYEKAIAAGAIKMQPNCKKCYSKRRVLTGMTTLFDGSAALPGLKRLVSTMKCRC